MPNIAVAGFICFEYLLPNPDANRSVNRMVTNAYAPGPMNRVYFWISITSMAINARPIKKKKLHPRQVNFSPFMRNGIRFMGIMNNRAMINMIIINSLDSGKPLNS